MIVSGIIRNNNHIIVDINYKSESEKEIIQKYIITPVQIELDSVKNILNSNRIFITDIVPKYNLVTDIEPLPKIPENIVLPKVDEKLLKLNKLQGDYFLALKNKNKKLAMKIIENIVEEDKENYSLWIQYGVFYSEINYKQDKALKGFNNAVIFGPNNAISHNYLGHYAGEYLLDIDLSFNEFEIAHNLNPHHLNKLNYAEACITKNKYEKAINLCQEIISSSLELKYMVVATFLLTCSKLLMGQEKNEMKNDILFVIQLLKNSNPRTTINYKTNKLLYYVDQLNPKEKKLIVFLIEAISGNIPKEELIPRIETFFQVK